MNDRSRYRFRRLRLGQRDDSDLAALDPSARVAMVWQLTADAWGFKIGDSSEPQLRRDVVRLVRDAIK